MKIIIRLTLNIAILVCVISPVYAQSRGDDSWEWIHTDQSTWYKPKQIRIKWEKDTKEERIIIPVTGLKVTLEPYPAQLLCDYAFESRLDQFTFPDVSHSQMIRFTENVGFVGEVHSRFKLYLNQDVGYDLSSESHPERVIIHLYSLKSHNIKPVPHYFIQSNEIYPKKDLHTILIQLGTETDQKDIYKVRIRELDGIQIRVSPVDLEHHYIWIGPFDTTANAEAARPKFYQYYQNKKTDDELSAFKQYLTYHLRPTQESGYDIKSLREEFLKNYRAKSHQKDNYEGLYRSLSEQSTIVEY